MSYLTHMQRTLLSWSVLLVEHCNLKCVGCNNFGPLAEESYLDIDEYGKDCDRLSFITSGQADLIQLLGGEPLLHPQVVDFFRVTRKYFNSACILLITNGILLPKMPVSFWEGCKEHKIIISITEYPIGLDYSEIEGIAKKFGVILTYVHGRRQKMMFNINLDLFGRIDNYKHARMCEQHNLCCSLSHGKFHCCQLVSTLHIFNKYFNQNIPITAEDELSIYDVSSVEEIDRFLREPRPICKYCIVSSRVDFPWRLSKCDISEWVYNPASFSLDSSSPDPK